MMQDLLKIFKIFFLKVLFFRGKKTVITFFYMTLFHTLSDPKMYLFIYYALKTFM